GGVAAAVNLSAELRVWKAGRARGLGQAGHQVPKVVLSLDGRRVATSDSARPLTVWDVDSGRSLFTLNDSTPLCFGPAGRRLLAAHDRQAKLLDADTGEVLLALAGPVGEGPCAAFERGGRRVATGGADGVLRVWDAATGGQKLACKGREGPLIGVAFSADGLRLVSASKDGTVRLWDAETGQEKLTLKRPPVTGAAVSI